MLRCECEWSGQKSDLVETFTIYGQEFGCPECGETEGLEEVE